MIVPLRTVGIYNRRINRFQLGTVQNISMLIGPRRTHSSQIAFSKIHHFITITSVDKDTQVEAFIAERIVPSKCEFRHGWTDIGTVILIYHTITIQVFVFNITHIYSISTIKHSIRRIFHRFGWSLQIGKVLINTICHISIKRVETFACIRKAY